MKMIVAIIRPEQLAILELILRQYDIEAMTVAETRDYCPREEHSTNERTQRKRIRSRLEFVVHDYDADDIVDAITESKVSARRDLDFDCKIIVISLDHYVDLSSRRLQALPVRSR